MTREEFFNKLKTGAKWDVGVAINRTNPVPLDANEIFESIATMEAYIKSNALAYPGQIVVVLGETETAAYLVNAVGGEGKGYVKLAATTGSGDVGEELTQLAARVAVVEGYFEGGIAKKATADAAGNVIADTYATKAALATTEANAQKGIADAATAQAAAEAAQTAADAAVKTTDFETFKTTNTAAIAAAKKAGDDAQTALDEYKASNDAALAGVKTTADAALPKATYDEFIETVNAAAIADAKKAGTDASAALEAYKNINDPKVAKNAQDIATINTKITGLTGAMHFRGVLEALPEDKTGYAAGDVVIVGDKEYVLTDEDGTKTWHELGDEGSHATKEYVDTAKQAAIDAANAATDEKLTEYSKTTVVEGLIATAKGEAITEAGAAADTKITNALKDYTTTADLTTELGKKVDKATGKSLVDDTLITKMEGLQDNAVIKGVEGGIKLDAETGKISVDAATMPVIAQSKVDGLETALAGKQDKNQTLTDIAALSGAGLVKKTADGVELDTNAYITDAALADYAKSADVTQEINAAVADKQTAEQVNALIAAATIEGSKVNGAVAEATTAATANKVANALTIGSETYDGSAPVEVTAATLGALTEVPAATAEKIGGFKLATEEEKTAEITATHRLVELDVHNHAYVDIPAAMVYSAKADGGLELTDGAFGIKAAGVKNSMIESVSTDKLTQGTQVLVIAGGNATV